MTIVSSEDKPRAPWVVIVLRWPNNPWGGDIVSFYAHNDEHVREVGDSMLGGGIPDDIWANRLTEETWLAPGESFDEDDD